MDWQYSMKICFVGDTGVGKTYLLHSLLNKTQNYIEGSTIGVDCHYLYKEILLNNNYYNIKTLFWDTAGQERFNSIVKLYYKKVTCICIIFDLTDKKRNNMINKWLNRIKIYINPLVKIILVGNKADLPHEKFVNKYKYPFIEVSAKKNNELEIILNKIIRLNLQYLENNNLFNVDELGTKTNNEITPNYYSFNTQGNTKINNCCNIL